MFKSLIIATFGTSMLAAPAYVEGCKTKIAAIDTAIFAPENANRADKDLIVKIRNQAFAACHNGDRYTVKVLVKQLKLRLNMAS